MKRKVGLLIVMIIITTLCSMVFVGCKNKKVEDVNSVTIVLRNQEVDVVKTISLKEANLTSKDHVLDVLRYANSLDKNNENYINYTISGNEPYTYISAIGTLKESTNQYIAVYTSIESDADVSEYAEAPIVYKDTTLYYSGVGIASMKLESNAIYMFVLIEFNLNY